MSLYLGMGIEVTTVTLSNPCLTSPIYLKFVPYSGKSLLYSTPGLAQYKHLFLSPEETFFHVCVYASPYLESKGSQYQYENQLHIYTSVYP